MADKRDYYEVLGVPKGADDAAIKKAFRAVAKKYHPDMHPGDKECEEKFKEAQEAYAVLSDPEKRRQYDQFGHAAFDGAGGAGGFDFSGMDFSDIFGDIFGDSGFAGFGGRGHQQRTAQHRGSDLRLKVRLSLKEISTGVTKKFKVKRDMTCSHCHGTGAENGSGTETCQTCHGSGYVIRTTQSLFGMMQTQSVCPTCGGEGTVIKNKCNKCGGTGVVKGEEVVEISIPAGVSEGMIVNVSGKGNAGKRNGIAGNIQVYIEEEPNDTFIRDDNDLIYNLLLDFPTAVLGGNVEIPTIDGSKVRIKIEPGTQPGKALRLRGKGLPSVQGYGRGVGDMVVNISVYVPKTLSKSEKEALEEMKNSDNFKGDEATKRAIFHSFRNYFN